MRSPPSMKLSHVFMIVVLLLTKSKFNLPCRNSVGVQTEAAAWKMRSIASSVNAIKNLMALTVKIAL